jgi:hypothetical protein
MRGRSGRLRSDESHRRADAGADQRRELAQRARELAHGHAAAECPRPPRSALARRDSRTSMRRCRARAGRARAERGVSASTTPDTERPSAEHALYANDGHGPYSASTR